MPTDLYQAVGYSLIVFVLLITLTRIIGKKLLAQMTFFDFVAGITIGTIGGAFVTTEEYKKGGGRVTGHPVHRRKAIRGPAPGLPRVRPGGGRRRLGDLKVKFLIIIK